MDAHLTKPIDRAQLQACFARYLDGEAAAPPTRVLFAQDTLRS
jgi:hypothetical protein